MKLLSAESKLVELVQDSILAEIASGKLAPGTPIDQAHLAAAFGASRQQVQHALLALRGLGVVREATGHGLEVAPLDLDQVRDMYDLRAVIEGLAFRKAAERNPGRAQAEGRELIQAGRKAVARGLVADMIEADIAFHDFIHALSGNPLVAPALAAYWINTQRVMGGVLMRGESPRTTWDQHQALLDAVAAGDGETAERLARQHIGQAADFMVEHLRQEAAQR